MKKNKVDWSQASKDILGLIAERLNSIEDYVRFGAVCRSWKEVIINQRNSKFSPKTLPWLMFPLCKNGGDQVPNFYSVSSDICYTIDLPETHSCYFTGSHYGWLILVDVERLELYNPLSRIRIPLPQLLTGDYNNRARLFMPSVGKYVVVIDMGKELCFVRDEDLAWTTIATVDDGNDCVDVLCLSNLFYIVDSQGSIRRVDITSIRPVATKFVEPPKDIEGEDSTFYLLELLGELHMVVKYDVSDDERRYYVRVFKLDLSTKKWEELITLGDYTFFVGRNSSFSIRASDFEYCRHGCIYFNDTLDAGWNTTSDIWIFDIENDDMEVLSTHEEKINLYSCPAWFTPSLC